VAQGEEGLGHRLILGARRTEAETRDDSRRVYGGEQAEALVPPQTVGPSDVGVTGQPSFASTLGISDGYSRTIQSFEAAVVLFFSSSSSSSGAQEEGWQVQG
jgi:hypothetical protein